MTPLCPRLSSRSSGAACGRRQPRASTSQARSRQRRQQRAAHGHDASCYEDSALDLPGLPPRQLLGAHAEELAELCGKILTIPATKVAPGHVVVVPRAKPLNPVPDLRVALACDAQPLPLHVEAVVARGGGSDLHALGLKLVADGAVTLGDPDGPVNDLHGAYLALLWDLLQEDLHWLGRKGLARGARPASALDGFDLSQNG
eukprot:CAMPEP_0171175644 /NCGR_PEP_ID=MMETSP0790-20130122/11332_1 /TAXON_ID=2925 /ORGANISM="Alexandrium catenella, Strain OF101" /LENGTH=201 /DNA_ID=CAMNT_0011640521 /DNA_START=373 /DNA_END=976 /DNA_ORIENTATION=+